MQAKRTLKKAETFLGNGGNISISIEGRRSTKGALSPYKKGPVVLAINAQATIVPVVIQGSKGCMGFRRRYDQEKVVMVKLLSPISTVGMNYDDRDELVVQLFEIAQKAVHACSFPTPRKNGLLN
jgi:1-acyl-sn-glycerol-3-phosphate acyltransferase